MKTFLELALHPSLLAAIDKKGYREPTPIQAAAIPHVIVGRDVVALAQTGTGKTAAFALPLLHRLTLKHADGPRAIRVLVLAPTRELAAQIADDFSAYGEQLPFRVALIFGGVGKDAQLRALRSGVDVLVATPGRLLDLMSEQRIDFSKLDALVLDEADRMLDMGFIHDVKRVLAALPKTRQTLLFSATMPASVAELAKNISREPVRVEVAPPSTTVERIAQSVFLVDADRKRDLLAHLLRDGAVKRALVFTRTKHGANRVAEFLAKRGVSSAAIHGNKSQNARERALASFEEGATRVLVATDIAARGLDIDDVSHVIQMDLPNVPEQYVHRIGRTARAGADGIAWSFCARDERDLLRDIEKDIRMKVPVATHPFTNPNAAGNDAHAHAPRNDDARSHGDRRGHANGNANGNGGDQRNAGRSHRNGMSASARPSSSRRGGGGGARAMTRQ